MSPPILLLIAVFVAVAIVGGIAGVRQLDDAFQNQSLLSQANADLDGLLRSQLAETSAPRGDAAIRERLFLNPRDATDLPSDKRAARLEGEVERAGIPSGEQIVRELRAAHRQWEDDVVQQHAVSGSDGGAAMERMSSIARTLRFAIDTRSNQVERELRRRINATVAVSVGTITIFAIAAFALGVSRAAAMQALANEQALVAALQRTLRVEGLALPGAALGFSYTSATREALVGGDLIDAWRIDADRGWVLIADASGKGIQAARHSAFVQYAIRALTAETRDPGDVLERFNRLFLATFADPGIFVVLFLAAFDARDGSLRYASAGHASAFVLRGSEIEQLLPTGPIIGLDAGERYDVRATVLDARQSLVLATDGLTEARAADGDFLGDEGVIELLRGQHAQQPQEICDRLVAEVERRSRGGIADDLAILTVRVLEVNRNQSSAGIDILAQRSGLGDSTR